MMIVPAVVRAGNRTELEARELKKEEVMKTGSGEIKSD
jgi:hypothetical protein